MILMLFCILMGAGYAFVPFGPASVMILISFLCFLGFYKFCLYNSKEFADFCMEKLIKKFKERMNNNKIINAKKVAIKLKNRGYYHEALTCYKDLLQKVPNDRNISTLIYECYEAIGDYEGMSNFYKSFP